MLTCENISLSRGREMIFSNLGFTVGRKNCMRIVGANGSGKTSLLRIIARLIRNHEGAILYNGVNVDTDLPCYYSQLLYVRDIPVIDNGLTVLQNISFWARIYDMAEGVVTVLEMLRLSNKANLIVGNLSRGEKQLLSLARLLLTHAPLWLLDEPFSYLDDEMCAVLSNIINAKSGSGGLVIFTAHSSKLYDINNLDTLELELFTNE